MARPRGTARSRRHAPPLDKPSRSGLLALRRFHDGLQTPTLVRLLVRTKKEEISTGQKNYQLILSPSLSGRQAAGRAHAPRPHLHDIPKRNRIWKPEISKCDFFFWAEHGGKWAVSASPTRDTRQRPPRPRLHQNSSWKPFDFNSAYFSALKLKRLASLRCEGLAVSPVSSSIPRRLILL